MVRLGGGGGEVGRITAERRQSMLGLFSNCFRKTIGHSVALDGYSQLGTDMRAWTTGEEGG